MNNDKKQKKKKDDNHKERDTEKKGKVMGPKEDGKGL